MNLKEAILISVNSHQGIKGVELAINVMGLTNPVLYDGQDYADAVNSLVKEGEIVELEYTLPQMEFRLKSLYFPKGTILNLEIEMNEHCKNNGCYLDEFDNSIIDSLGEQPTGEK